MTVLDKLVEQRAALVSKRDALLAAVETRGDTNLTPEEDTEFRAILDELNPLDERIAQLAEQRARDLAAARATPTVRVTNEPTVYGRGMGNSYFRDLAKAAPQGGSDPAAQDRLRRHAQEVDVELRNKPELRANMNRTDGTGGEFVPPLWLINQYVPAARAARVTADLCSGQPLPAGTDTVSLPKINVATAVAEQSDGASVQKTDMTTTSVSAAVTTMAGQQVFAMQLLDQSPINFDEVVFKDLIADMAVKVDTYVISKASIGILNITGINAITYTDASPTVPELYPKIADGIQQIHTNRFLPPTAIVMHPRRWAWHTAALDSSNRPLVVPSAQGPYLSPAEVGAVASQGYVGQLQGLNVYTDPNVPINLGAGTNEDRIIVAKFDDLYLYEGPIRSRVLFETDADTLSVRLQVWEYLAFLGNRFAKSVSVVSGTGLVTPTF